LEKGNTRDTESVHQTRKKRRPAPTSIGKNVVKRRPALMQGDKYPARRTTVKTKKNKGKKKSCDEICGRFTKKKVDNGYIHPRPKRPKNPKSQK